MSFILFVVVFGVCFECLFFRSVFVEDLDITFTDNWARRIFRK